MKTVVDRKNFLEALDIVGSVVSGDEERYGSVIVLRRRNGRLVLGATDGVTFVETEVAVDSEEAAAGDPAHVMVVYDRVKRVASNADGSAIELTYGPTEVVVSSGADSSVPFDVISLDAYPWFDQTIEGAKPGGTVPSAKLRAAIGFLKPFIYDKASALAFTVAETRLVKGANDTQVRVVLASDKLRLAVWSCDDLAVDLRVPFDQAPRLVTILGRREPDATVEVLDSDKHSVFRILGPAIGSNPGLATTYGFLKPEARFPTDLKNFPTTVPPTGPMVDILSFSKTAMKKAIECVIAPLEKADQHPITVQVFGIGADARIVVTTKHPSGKKDPRWEFSAARFPGGPDPSTVGPLLLTGEVVQEAISPIPGEEVLLVIRTDPKQGWVQFSGIEKDGDGKSISDGRASVLLNRRRSS